jgi:RNA polymerase sigma factor (sigma-70 family)
MAESNRNKIRHSDYAQLHVELERPLRAYFSKRVRNASEVDDLVQELFRRLIDQPDPAEIDNPTAYVFQAASNLLRDRARRKSTWSSVRNELHHRQGEMFEEISPERVLMGREAVQRLLEVLDQLPERTRAVFLLHRYEGFKYREIADRLEISVSSVEKHMIAAIHHLTRKMGKLE